MFLIRHYVVNGHVNAISVHMSVHVSAWYGDRKSSKDEKQKGRSEADRRMTPVCSGGGQRQKVSESLALPLCFDSAGREKRKGPMISAGDAEFPRDFPLAVSGGRRGRRFPDNSNGGFTSSSLDRRHNSVAAKSLEALNNPHKADVERQRDALMDFQKNRFSSSPGGGSQGSAAGRQVCAWTRWHGASL